MPYLTDTGDLPAYREVAAALELTEGAVKVAVHRLRQRFGAVLRLEIGDTVVSPADVDDEMRELIRVVSTSMSCARHPLAAAHAGHCPACLIEGAFFEPEAAEGGGRRALTILMPLGGSPGSAVFLVREQGRARRLLRLKTWRRPAPPGLSHGVRTAAHAPGGVAAAPVSKCRRRRPSTPAVARSCSASSGRALPIVGQVRIGTRSTLAGRVALLRALVASTGRGTRRGLGAWRRSAPATSSSDGRSAYLLDFGLTAIVSRPDAGLAPRRPETWRDSRRSSGACGTRSARGDARPCNLAPVFLK